VSKEQRRHLILGPPGSGKTHALWHAAHQLLRAGDVIPVFLPAGQVNRWDDLASMIREAAPALSLDDVLRDPRVCLLIDGWSEFASGEHVGEKQKTLRALRNTRLIANGKVSDVGDTPFKSWSLELLSPQQVAEVLEAARPGEPVLPAPVFDLLRLPLLLSIHVLSDATASATGDSPMQPKAMQDVLNAMAKAYPTGVPAIVQFISQHRDALPAYHIAQALWLYEAWRERSGGQLFVQLPTGESLPFSQWIARHSALYRWEDHFTPEMLSPSPDLAVEVVLNHLKDDVEKSVAVLKALKDVRSYNADLLDYMLAVPKLAELIPGVFASAFDTFPVAALHRCMASPDIDQNILLFRLGATSNPVHRLVHADLIQRVLTGPVDLHHDRYVANMLRGHTAEDLDSLLRNAEGVGGDGWLWLVREVEAARGERLINEAGELRRK
jgi:hypothetical protein